MEIQTPFYHQVYFKLADRRASTRQMFVDHIKKLLSPKTHVGMSKLKIGLRAVEMQRPVNDLEFDVVMDMEFESFDAYLDYAKHPDHDRWITEVGSMSTHRRVFDSFQI